MERLNRAKPLTQELKAAIIILYNENKTYAEISQRLQVNKNTIFLWVNRFINEGNLQSQYKNNGRKRITTPEIDDEIYETVRTTPFITVSSIARNYPFSYSTVIRRINEKEIFHYKPARQAKLTDAHREARKAFCEVNGDTDWEKVIFSDEKTFKSYDDTMQNLWRPPNERYNPIYEQSVPRSGRITCGVWAYITAGGVGEMCEIVSRMNSTEYVSVLDEVFLPSLEITYGEYAGQLQFVQDNAPWHKSRATKRYLDAHPEIRVVNWPAFSPDLNDV